jgi:hypothetical protein
MKNLPEFITPENLQNERKPVFSPSDRYQLQIRSYQTKEGCWSYTRGTVTRISDGQEICDLVRNYSDFLHTFVCKGDREYLITGEKYTSQTVVNLETGEVMQAVPDDIEAEDKNLGFCWASVTSVGEDLLFVEGCYWAASYEFRFYDFSDPEKNRWPHLPVITEQEYEKHKEALARGELPEDLIYNQEFLPADATPPVFEDGRIIVRETEAVYKPTGQREYSISCEELDSIDEDEYEKESNWKRVADVERVLERRGPALVITREWKSDHRKDAEARQKAYQEKQDAELRHFQETDTFLPVARRVLEQSPVFELGGVGFMGSSQKAREEGEKNHWFFSLWVRQINDEKRSNPECHVQWGTVNGDFLTLSINHYQIKHYEKKEFSKSEQGMLDLLSYLAEYIEKAKTNASKTVD